MEHHLLVTLDVQVKNTFITVPEHDEFEEVQSKRCREFKSCPYYLHQVMEEPCQEQDGLTVCDAPLECGIDTPSTPSDPGSLSTSTRASNVAFCWPQGAALVTEIGPCSGRPHTAHIPLLPSSATNMCGYFEELDPCYLARKPVQQIKDGKAYTCGDAHPGVELRPIGFGISELADPIYETTSICFDEQPRWTSDVQEYANAFSSARSELRTTSSSCFISAVEAGLVSTTPLQSGSLFQPLCLTRDEQRRRSLQRCNEELMQQVETSPCELSLDRCSHVSSPCCDDIPEYDQSSDIVMPPVAIEAIDETQSKLGDEVASVSATISTHRRSRRTRINRLWCHFHLDDAMLREPGFDLVKKIIGRSGCNTRSIFEQTRTKVRVRGKGSGHQERHNGREAPVPLQVAIAAEHGNEDDFRNAFTKVRDLLLDVSSRFSRHVQRRDSSHLASETQSYFWVGDLSDASRACLGVLLEHES